MQARFNDLEVRLAKIEHEIKQAQALRAAVFEPDKVGLELDCDEYDKFCDHLLVFDRTKNSVVGTYRLLPQNKAKKIGFHAEKIFDITNIKKIRGNILELGRSCVHPAYRSSLVINLLWNGLLEYINKHGVEFLIGCPRLDIYNIKEISRAFAFLKRNFYTDEAFRVYPLPDCHISLIEDIDVFEPETILRRLPPLVKGYLKSGARICGLPALNKEFSSIVLFMLLDLSQINPAYKRRFSKTRF